MTHGGVLRSENAGTSNRKEGETPSRRNTEVSRAMVIIPGLVGPKPIPNGGGDGEQVNIPAHQCSPMEGRSAVCTAGYWIPVGALRRLRRQIRVAILQGESQDEDSSESSVQSALPRKTSFGLTT